MRYGINIKGYAAGSINYLAYSYFVRNPKWEIA
jgi:hypothetical protein